MPARTLRRRAAGRAGSDRWISASALQRYLDDDATPGCREGSVEVAAVVHATVLPAVRGREGLDIDSLRREQHAIDERGIRRLRDLESIEDGAAVVVADHELQPRPPLPRA